MGKSKERKTRRLGKGGYPSGDRLVSELPPPPPGPAPGARPVEQENKNSDSTAKQG